MLNTLFFSHLAGEFVVDAQTKKATRRQELERLFDHFDEGSGTLTYGQVFAIAEPLLKDIQKNIQEKELDALGLVIQIASDADGAVTKTEFLEFLMSLFESAEVAESKPTLKPTFTQRFDFRKLKDNTISVVKKEVRELMDSVSMVGQDLSYSAALLRSPPDLPDGMARFSETETAWLWRSLKDLVLFLPIGAIIVAPLTPVGSSSLREWKVFGTPSS